MNRRLSIAWRAVWMIGLFALTTFLPVSAWADREPFRGEGKGAIVGVAPDPAGVALTIQSQGKASRLGKFLRQENLLLNPFTGELHGTIVFQSANGDLLFGEVNGAFISPTTAIGSYTLFGGTGRFLNSSGRADFVAVSADGIQVIIAFSGTLEGVGGNGK